MCTLLPPPQSQSSTGPIHTSVLTQAATKITTPSSVAAHSHPPLQYLVRPSLAPSMTILTIFVLDALMGMCLVKAYALSATIAEPGSTPVSVSATM